MLSCCHFNLSHSGPYVLRALRAEGPVGIDVEDASRHIKDLDGVVARFFHPGEKDAFVLLADEYRRKVFVRMWVLKEAIIKMWGGSIAYDLDKIECCWDDGGCVTLSPGFLSQFKGRYDWVVPHHGCFGALAYSSEYLTVNNTILLDV